MANEFQHKGVGSALTQIEYEASDGTGHVLDSQAEGDIIYASSATVLSRLGKGDDAQVLTLASGVPSWAAIPTPATVSGGTQAAITTLANVTTVGALNAGSITSGFTSVDVGSGGLTTTGAIAGGTIDAGTDFTVGTTVITDGTITLGDTGQLLFSDDAPSTDDTATGEVWTMTALTGIAVGELVHIDVNGKLDEAHADATADMPAIGIALTANSSGSDAEINILTRGIYRDDGQFAFTPGLAVYVSAATEGQFTQTAPSSDGNFVQRVGIALTADSIWFNPSVDVIEHA